MSSSRLSRPARLSRRSLLKAGAGALGAAPLSAAAAVAAPAAKPWPALARTRATTPAGSVYDLALGRLGPGTTAVSLPAAAEMVGLSWQSPRSAAIELRLWRAGEGWSGWAQAGAHAHRDEQPAAGAPSGGEPVWSAGATELQLRSASALSAVSLHAVVLSSEPHAARAAAALPLAEPLLAAGGGQPPIIARQAWADGRCPPSEAPGYGAVELAFVHHTDNPNGYLPGEVPAMLRAIYLYHRYVRGWHDIGYNFVLDLYGRIWEARAGGIDEAVVGAQAGGYNLYSTGAAVLGTFSATRISAQAYASLEALLAWKLALHGVPAIGETVVQVSPSGSVYSRFPVGAQVRLPRIAGHREADTTDCPGDVLYAELPAIRRAVAKRAGTPVQATITLVQVPGAQAPPLLADGAAPGRYLFGTLTRTEGSPLAGAQVALQTRSVARRGEQVSESTITQTSTNEQGEWSVPAPPPPPGATAPRQALRALYAGPEGAAVSESLAVRLAP